ncbi:hypothetical protein MVEN_00030600 [Mycena venus]|uniref:Uncharacterized protein n=1 Tax=Mycena venus TaxID=2733690 RepID=A0A8H7DHN2_9AGAR|nr:hypothetical protein MVEN_00030600 [Mycena venus]
MTFSCAGVSVKGTVFSRPRAGLGAGWGIGEKVERPRSGNFELQHGPLPTKPAAERIVAVLFIQFSFQSFNTRMLIILLSDRSSNHPRAGPSISQSRCALFWTASGLSVFGAALRTMLPESSMFVKCCLWQALSSSRTARRI